MREALEERGPDLLRQLHHAARRLLQQHVHPAERGEQRLLVVRAHVRRKRVDQRVHLELRVLRLLQQRAPATVTNARVGGGGRACTCLFSSDACWGGGWGGAHSVASARAAASRISSSLCERDERIAFRTCAQKGSSCSRPCETNVWSHVIAVSRENLSCDAECWTSTCATHGACTQQCTQWEVHGVGSAHGAAPTNTWMIGA